MGLLVNIQSALERFTSQQSGYNSQEIRNINKLFHNLVFSCERREKAKILVELI